MRALDALAAFSRRGTYLDNPSEPLTGANISSALATAGDLWGDAAGKVDPMQIGAVFRSVQILGDVVAGCPLKVYTDSGDPKEGRREVKLPVLTMERQGTTPFELWQQVVAHLALWGNAYLRKIYSRGRLVELVPIHPARVHVDTDDEEAARELGMPYVKRFVVDNRVDDPLTEREILHIPGLVIDGVKGLSVIGAARRTFELAANAEIVAGKMYASGMMSSGVVSLPAPPNDARERAAHRKMTDEDALILKRRWQALSAGMQNASDVIVLTDGATYEQLTMSPADAQFLETRKFSVTEIARLFGLPGWVLNDQEKSTSWGTGMETMFTTMVKITLGGYFKRIEQRVTREICDPSRETAEFLLDALLRGDSKARAESYKAGIQFGYYTPNDVRSWENMPPVEWGDEPYRPYTDSNGTSTDSTEDQPDSKEGQSDADDE